MYRNKKNILLLFSIIILLMYSCTPVVKKPESQGSKKKRANVKRRENQPDFGKLRKNWKYQGSFEGEIKGQLDPFIEKYWGRKYKYGAIGPYTFDCSGFTQRVFKEAYGFTLPRTSRQQYRAGVSVSKGNLRYGDLVFFNTSGKGVSHVGVYIGNNKFAHASTSQGITTSSLGNSYYRKRFIGGRRVLR